MTEQVTVYVGTLESGEHDDYQMYINGVFASLEDAQAAFSQEPVKDAFDEDAEPQEWGEWEPCPEGSAGAWWTQRLGE